MAEPAPTRRSSRTSPTPVQASSETPGPSRAELRRKAAGASAERPAVVWGRPVEEKQKDAAPLVAPEAPVIAVEPEEPVHVQPLTDLPAAPVERARPVEEAPVPVEVPAAPLSRRARRAPQTAEQPAVALPPMLAPAEPFELLEPVVAPTADEPVVLEVVADDAPIIPEPVVQATAEPVEVAESSEPQVEASAADDFEAAARLFSFTGELPVQDAEPAVSVEDEAEPTPAPAAHAAPRRAKVSRGTAFKRVTTASFSVGVMGIVGLMTVGMTTPAEAVAAASGMDASLSIIAPGDGSVTEIDADEIQAYVAPAGVQPEILERAGGYDTTTIAELASESGIRNFSNLFVNDPNAPIQWPFAVGVTMSYGFGMRSGRMHEGVDFTPGAGAPIQAIADGTVRVASEAGGAYGVHVIIDHMIDGQLVSSHYAHMQYGSLQVVTGQKVTVGTVLGHTGNTGRSYGAHTHFEILLNGKTAIDPLPWLREHTGG